VRAHYHINQELCRQEAVDQINKVLDGSQENKRFWNVELKHNIVKKFKAALTAEELPADFDLQALIAPKILSVVDRIMQLAGTKQVFAFCME